MRQLLDQADVADCAASVRLRVNVANFEAAAGDKNDKIDLWNGGERVSGEIGEWRDRRIVVTLNLRVRDGRHEDDGGGGENSLQLLRVGGHSRGGGVVAQLAGELIDERLGFLQDATHSRRTSNGRQSPLTASIAMKSVCGPRCAPIA